MSDLRQAAQQALEAYDSHEPLAVVMDALRAALEQYDKDRVWIEERKAHWAADRERVRANAAEESARIAQAAEEGKCWACGALKQDVPETDCGNMEPVARVIDNGTPEGSTEWIPYSARQVPVKTGDFLYTHPPHREWRGLTEEEFVQIELKLRKYHDYDRYDLSLNEFARAIEAALKERNA